MLAEPFASCEANISLNSAKPRGSFTRNGNALRAQAVGVVDHVLAAELFELVGGLAEGLAELSSLPCSEPEPAPAAVSDSKRFG